MDRRQFIAAGLVMAGVAAVSSLPAKADKAPIYTSTLSNAAVGGYDPVAYFTDGKPTKGLSDFQTEWKGADWYFASKENLEKFKAMPEKYAPQFGGYCAYGVAKGAAVKGDPELWKIVDGKLYLNINKQVSELWNKDVPGFIAKADANWPKVLK